MKKSIKKLASKSIYNSSAIKGGRLGDKIGMESSEAERTQIRLEKRMN